MLQLAALLGFSGDELVILRATMMAWMLPTDDHSFFEIMLGGEAYVPPAYRMAMGLHDLGRLWPPNATITTSDGQSFSGATVWRRVGQRLKAAPPELLDGMAASAQAYVRGLVSSAGYETKLVEELDAVAPDRGGERVEAQEAPCDL